ncbi:MAG: PilZ domain-containing protein [Deltaproteobacteria bacterium]|nr:PilZ domain-containing protein [Deltaproteobacteria bacterium]
MVEHRTFKRLEIPLLLRMKLLGTAKHDQPVKSQTKNVSLDGLLIEVQVFLENDSLIIQKGDAPVKLGPFLVLNEKLVELDIWIPPKAQRIKAIGRVVWYDLCSRGTSYYFSAGISLEKMGAEDGKKWANFVSNIAQV